jgi:hypothetical protein
MTAGRLKGLIICLAGVGIFAALNVAPLWGDHFFDCGESVYAARLAVSAQRSLAAGQFPLQYANDFYVALRPVFLFYTPGYYGAAAVTQLVTGLDPYLVSLILIVVIALSATYGTYFTTRLLGGSPVMSGLTAAALPFSPYFMTDIFSRGAYAELSVWGIFPWMMFYFVEFCRKPRMLSGILFIVATSLLILCHKIFFPWAVIWLGLLGLLLFGFRRILALSPYLILCGLAALSFTAPYWANAMLLGDSLNVVRDASHDVAYRELTANLTVFSPLSYLDPSLAEMWKHFNLQLGPLIVLSAIGSLFYFRVVPLRAMILTTMVVSLFVCSFFVTFDFWRRLPSFLIIIQFPYRLLLFATIFGTIASGLALTAVARDSWVYAYGTFSAALLLLFVSFWWRADISRCHVNRYNIVEFANTADSYFENGGPRSVDVNPKYLPRSALKAVGSEVTAAISMDQPGSVVLPVQYSRRLTTLVDEKPHEISNSSGLVSISLPAGTSNVYIRRDEPIGFLIGLSFSAAFGVALSFLLRNQRSQSVNNRSKQLALEQNARTHSNTRRHSV